VVYNADPRYASIISGIPGHDIEDVKLSNIRIFYQGGGTKEQAALIPPEEEKGYPEPRMFGNIPAYGFFLRHVRGIQFDNVQVSVMKEDLRPAFVMDSVTGVELNNVKAQHAPNVPTFVLKNVDDFTVHQLIPGDGGYPSGQREGKGIPRRLSGRATMARSNR
jgi:hypothetical protein